MKTRCSAIAIAWLVALLAGGCGGGSDPAGKSDGDKPAAPAEGDSSSQSSGGGYGSAGTAGAVKASEVDLLHPVVNIETSAGKITLQLDVEHAPGTVANFLNYVNSGHYDQTLFHYVDRGSVILGGGFNAELKPKETSAPIRNEAHNSPANKRGTIAMSRSFESIDSATCQFFINVVDNPDLDHKDETPEGYGYCVFGKVIEGLEIVDRIAQSPVHDSGEFVSTPKSRVVIQSMRLIR